MDPVTGKQLSKRDGALSMRTLRDAGWTPEEVIEKAMAGDGTPGA
jgi:glutamyl/glutaminyl-tRNA synthetase